MGKLLFYLIFGVAKYSPFPLWIFFFWVGLCWWLIFARVALALAYISQDQDKIQHHESKHCVVTSVSIVLVVKSSKNQSSKKIRGSAVRTLKSSEIILKWSLWTQQEFPVSKFSSKSHEIPTSFNQPSQFSGWEWFNRGEGCGETWDPAGGAVCHPRIHGFILVRSNGVEWGE